MSLKKNLKFKYTPTFLEVLVASNLGYFIIQPVRLILTTILLSVAILFIFIASNLDLVLFPLSFLFAIFGFQIFIEIVMILTIILRSRLFLSEVELIFDREKMHSKRSDSGVEVKIPFSAIKKVKIIGDYIFLFLGGVRRPTWLYVGYLKDEERKYLKEFLVSLRH